MITTDDNKYFEYVSMGEFRTGNEWIHGERVMNSFELIVVLDGVVHIEEEEVRYSLGKNEMLILEPGKIHRGFQKSTPPTAFYWLHFITNAEIPFKTYRGSNYYEVKFLLKKLLLMSEMSVKEIAAAVGYKDDNLFVKFFRYHEDISPTVFRNMYKGTHMNNK